MASQEFLASFAVEVDEAGVARLQEVLEENRELADQLAAAFDAATSSIQLFSEELGSLPGFSSGIVEEGFFGRAAECVEEALSSAGAGGYLTDSGLCVVPAEGLPVSMSLSESDLLDEPVFTGEGLLLLRTPPVGWPLGKTVSVKWKDGSREGPVLERTVCADNLEGKWESELVVG